MPSDLAPEPLLDRARRLLKACPRDISLAHISRDTGLQVSWLSDFSKEDDERDFGVRKVQTLVDYLDRVCN